MRRKFLSVVLCVCMMLTMVPFAFAEGDELTSTLQSQIDAIQSEGTVTLDKDYTEIITIPQGNNITIDLSGHTLNGQLIVRGNATIKNGTVKAADNAVGIYAYGNLLLNGVTLTGAAKSENLLCVYAGSNVTIDKNSTVSATDTTENHPNPAIFIGKQNGNANDSQTLNIYGTVTAAKAPSIQGNGTDRSVSYINIYDGAEIKSSKLAVYLPQPCEVNMTGGTVEGYCGIGIKSGTLNLSGGTVNGIINDTVIGDQHSSPGGISYDGSAILIDSYIGYAGQVKINISGDATVKSNYSTAIREIGNNASQTNVVAVTVTGGKVLSGTSKDAIQMREASVSTVSLTGGTFSSDVSQYCAKNYYTEENEDNTYTVKSMKDIAVAQIGDTYYKTLADAYAALPRNVGDNSTPTTITVLKDSDGEAIGSDSDKDMNYVIDFNGHTYTVDKPTVGSTGTETQGLRVLKGSTAVFKNGTLKAANYQNMKMPVHTYGDVTFQDFTVDAREDSYASVAYEIDNGSLEMLGNSSILAYSGKTGLYVAFWPRGNYVDGTTVTINTTGKITGKLVYEWDDVADTNKQQTENKAVLKIENGNFAITGIETRFTNSILSNLKVPKIFISGGYFTIDPSTYVVEGKSALPGSYVIGDTTYNYKVDKALPSNVTVVPGATDVTAPPSMNQEDVSKIASSTIDNVSEKANEVASRLDNSKKATTEDMTKHLPASAPTVSPDATITTVVAPRLDIEVQSYDTKSKTLTLDIKAVYDIKATTANNVSSMIELNPDKSNASQVNTVTIEENAGKLDTTGTPVTVKLTLPGSFANEGAQLYVVHTKSTGEKYVHAVTVQEDDNSALYVEFVNDKGFSTFSISAVVAASITTNGDTTYYETLQDAVNAVQNGQTIKLEKNCDETATVSREVNFTLNPNDKTFSGTISADSRYSLTKTDGQDNTINYTVTYVGGGSSSGTTTSYNVNVNAATNGAVAADKKTASKGTTVTVTASPSKGYVVDAVKVVDKDGKDVAVTEKDGKYVFTMPASAVTVTGSFKAETPAPAALPFTDVKSGNWFYDAVKYAYEQGLMTGTSATTFAPNGTMNRAMIVTVLYRLEKSPAVTGASKFTDVPAGQWYSDAVAWAAANKIVNGYDETTFGPMNAVTREQMAAILFRYEQVKGLENVTLEENLNRFPDQNKISAYAIPALQWAVGQKIINGNADGTLDPTGTATRAQVAQIFTNLLNK